MCILICYSCCYMLILIVYRDTGYIYICILIVNVFIDLIKLNISTSYSDRSVLPSYLFTTIT